MAATKAYKGMGMEGAVAKWYSKLTLKSIEDFRTLAQTTARTLPAGANVLEVAPGPGYFAIELAKLGDFRITGLDISQTFVDIARANAVAARVRIDFERGNASEMPFADSSFDYILCRAAFKNFTEPLRALEEMYRVLKPGGRAQIIDLRRDASNEAIAEQVEKMHLGAVNSVITKLTFRFMLLKRAYTRPEFEEMAAKAGFRDVAIRQELTGLDVVLKKEA